MMTTWVPPEQLSHRIDCHFYRPELIANESAIRATGMCEKLDELRVIDKPITYGVVKPDLAETNFRMLRLQNIDSLWYDSCEAQRITEKQYREFRRAWCSPGDILVAIAGYIGLVGKVVDCEPQTINQHSARITVDRSKVDPEFLLAFASSQCGRLLLERYVSGTVQVGINLEDLREIRVPTSDSEFQHAIGAMIRKAECLRGLARRTLTRLQRLLTDVLHLQRLDRPDGTVSWTELGADVWGRLDAEYYQPRYAALERYFVEVRPSWRSVDKLSNLMVNGSYGVLPPSDIYGSGDLPFLRSEALGQFTIDHLNPILVPRSYANAKAIAQTGDILLEVKGNLHGGAICPQTTNGWLLNGSIYRMTPKPDVPAGYILAILLSEIGDLQKRRAAANSIISYLSLDFLNNLLIPRVNSDQESTIDDLVRAYQSYISECRGLVSCAKQTIESRIGGHFNRSQAIAEGQAAELWLRQNASATAAKGAVE